jgi:hypothetical protein
MNDIDLHGGKTVASGSARLILCHIKKRILVQWTKLSSSNKKNTWFSQDYFESSGWIRLMRQLYCLAITNTLFDHKTDFRGDVEFS